MNLVEEFDRSDHSENEARRAFASIKGPIVADYPYSDHVSHIVSNSAKNASNYLIPHARKAFNQLHQAFTEIPILQHFDPKQYIRVEIDVSRYAIGRVLSHLTNNLGQ